MSGTALTTCEWAGVPKLRLAFERKQRASTTRSAEQAALAKGSAPTGEFAPRGRISARGVRRWRSTMLIAGGDPARRAAVLDSLSDVAPLHTRYREVATLSELLLHAPLSRAVVLAGELDGVSEESLLRIVAGRHPNLPIMSVDSPGWQAAQAARA